MFTQEHMTEMVRKAVSMVGRRYPVLNADVLATEVVRQMESWISSEPSLDLPPATGVTLTVHVWGTTEESDLKAITVRYADGQERTTGINNGSGGPNPFSHKFFRWLMRSENQNRWMTTREVCVGMGENPDQFGGRAANVNSSFRLLEKRFGPTVLVKGKKNGFTAFCLRVEGVTWDCRG